MKISTTLLQSGYKVRDVCARLTRGFFFFLSIQRIRGTRKLSLWRTDFKFCLRIEVRAHRTTKLFKFNGYRVED